MVRTSSVQAGAWGRCSSLTRVGGGLQSNVCSVAIHIPRGVGFDCFLNEINVPLFMLHYADFYAFFAICFF